MTDNTTETTTGTAPAPETSAPAPETTTGAPETTGQAVETATNDVRHDAEVAAHHGLSHLEAEFVKYASEVLNYGENEAKAALEWIASKL